MIEFNLKLDPETKESLKRFRSATAKARSEIAEAIKRRDQRDRFWRRVLTGILIAVYVLFCAFMACFGAEPTHIETHHVRMPNYTVQPTLTAAKSGLMQSPTTWAERRVPDATDCVLIPEGVTVELAGGRVEVEAIGSRGTLKITGGELAVQTLTVFPEGSLLVGSQNKPIIAANPVTITIGGGDIDTTVDPEQYGQGLVCFGRCAMYGETKVPFVRLAQPVRAGDTKLLLIDKVDWGPGDKIWIPDSRTYDSEAVDGRLHEWREVRTVDGATVVLDRALDFDHEGLGSVLPHVSNCTRAITIQAGTTPAHVMFTGRANVDLVAVCWDRLGRTDNDQFIDDSEFDEITNTWRIGANPKGRYGPHWHHVYGPLPGVRIDGRVFAAINCVTLNEPWQKWGFTIHGTSFGLVQGHVGIGAGGACLMFEDRNEYHNRIEGCLWGASHGHGGRGKHAKLGGRPDGKNSWDSRRGGAAVWTGQGNDIVGCVMVGARKAGLEIWGDNDPPRDTLLRFPLYPGADLFMGVEGKDWRHIALSEVPWGEIRDIEVYGSRYGVEMWYANYTGYFVPNPNAPRGKLERVHAWNIEHEPLLCWQINNADLIDFAVPNQANRVFLPRAREVTFTRAKFPMGVRGDQLPGPVEWIDSEVGGGTGPDPEPDPPTPAPNPEWYLDLTLREVIEILEAMGPPKPVGPAE